MLRIFVAITLVAILLPGLSPAQTPLNAGDSNCDGANNLADLTYSIAFLFAGGPAPCDFPLVESGLSFGTGPNPNALYPATSVGQSYAQTTLSAPSAGYVMVTARCVVVASHISGSNDNIIGKVSQFSGDVSTPSFAASVMRIPASVPTGSDFFVVPMTINQVFPVPAGDVTFYFNAYDPTGGGDDAILGATISALFVPNSYEAPAPPASLAPPSEVAGSPDNSIDAGSQGNSQAK